MIFGAQINKLIFHMHKILQGMEKEQLSRDDPTTTLKIVGIFCLI